MEMTWVAFIVFVLFAASFGVVTVLSQGWRERVIWGTVSAVTAGVAVIVFLTGIGVING
jgi:uncharacterized membrane protein YagU involved in acid resistance